MHVAIVGAGVSGLTLAYRLSSHGIDVTLIERETRVGGLARSFAYPGGWTFDIGPHRIHSDDPNVSRFVEEVLASDRLVIGRRSELFLYDKYLPWPMTLRNVFSLPLTMLVRAGIDMLTPRRSIPDGSFDTYIVQRYGRTLYEVFFRPYTEKFLSYECRSIHSDWASTGINRATIDKKLETASLVAVVKGVLRPPEVDTSFLYPRSGGIGVFGERLAAAIRARGGRILLGTGVAALQTSQDRIMRLITGGGEEIRADHVFWSGSLNDLCALGARNGNPPELHYMSTVLFNYQLARPVPRNFQWCYCGEADAIVHRMSAPRQFNPALAPAGKDGLCVEITCPPESAVWKAPARVDAAVEAFLRRARVIRSLDDVEGCHIERVRETYPLYTLNYRRKLAAVCEWVARNWGNLTLLGRAGRFWYNNMDHSIGASLSVAELFLKDHASGALRAGSAYAVEDRELAGDPAAGVGAGKA